MTNPEDEPLPAPRAPVELRVGRYARLRRVRVAVGDIVEKRFFLLSSSLQVAAAVAMVAVLASAASTFYWLVRQPGRMSGDFNIAVAEFREIKGGVPARTDTSASIAARLHEYLSSELRGFDLEVEVAHDDMPYRRDATEAAELARRVGADLVIYGTVEKIGNRASLQPQFYVVAEVRGETGRRAGIGSDVEEVTSASAMVLPLALDPADEAGFMADLRARAAVLSYFAEGLIRLTDQDARAARAAFELAIDEAGGLQGFQGMEALQLYAAIACLRLGEYRAARDLLDRAQASSPDYGRAWIGRANLYYDLAVAGHETKDGCLVADLDDETAARCAQNDREEAWWYLVATAQGVYKQAAGAQDQQYELHVTDKGWLGYGNVRLLVAQLMGDLPQAHEDAVAAYRHVVDSYWQMPKKARPASGDRTAQAYWGMGVASQRLARLDEARVAFRRCAEVAYYDEEVRRICRENQRKLDAGATGP